MGADTERPKLGFQEAVINAERHVTRIAEPDDSGRLIGSPMLRPGVIAYARLALGLCGGMTGALFVTTTEVYPDSTRTSVAVNAAVGVLVGR